LYEDLALTHTNLRPHGVRAATVGEALPGHDLRFWRATTPGDWRSRILGMSKLALMPVIAAAIFYSCQGFVSRVQYFNLVASNPHPAPLAVTVEKFVRRTFGFATAAPSSAYEVETQMGSVALLNRWNPLVELASKRFGVPQAWIRAVMRMESGGRTMSSEAQPITSHAGAMGLMQVMPGTYREMRAQFGLGANAYDPHDNVFAGVAYLRWLHGKYGFPAMFAVYNDGPGHFEDRRAHGAALPAETQNYVNRIAATLGSDTTASRGARTVSFTRPSGERIIVAASSISSVRAALPGEYTADVNAVITMGKERQGVRESISSVNAALHKRGALLRFAGRSAQHHFRLAEFDRTKRVTTSYSLGG
jgi:soluble lytic murein transglycosylase-like protein